MNLKHPSIFNLIEIFRTNRKKILNKITPKTHCELNHMSDYYCDMEKIHIH